MNNTTLFAYEKIFDRNIGWLSTAEQAKLRQSHVVIAGLGGTGGFQAQVLSRLGIGSFTLVDPDRFEETNINRQIGATVATMGHSKTDVIKEMILSVNPSASVQVYPDKLEPGNLDQVLKGAQLAIDGIDFFATEAKLLLYRRAPELGIPVITSAPVGFGASLLIFGPGAMNAYDYFDLCDTMEKQEKDFALAFGLSPTPLCLSYMKGRNVLDIKNGRASSVCPSLMLTGALTGTEAVKILTGRGNILYAPHVYQTDLWTQQTVKKYYRWGMRSPWMRLKRSLIKKFIKV